MDRFPFHQAAADQICPSFCGGFGGSDFRSTFENIILLYFLDPWSDPRAPTNQLARTLRGQGGHKSVRNFRPTGAEFCVCLPHHLSPTDHIIFPGMAPIYMRTRFCLLIQSARPDPLKGPQASLREPCYQGCSANRQTLTNGGSL